MLRKRTRSLHKDQSMADSSSGTDSLNNPEKVGQYHKTNPLFSVPGLFIGLSSKAFSDVDSARSPTSPLEFRVFSNVGKSVRCPRSVHGGHLKCREGYCKVGLGIVDSLDDDVDVFGETLRPSESKKILFGQKIRSKINSCKSRGESFDMSRSLPKNFAILSHTKIKSPLLKGSTDAVFRIRDTSLESKFEEIGFCPSNSVDSNAGHSEGSSCGNTTTETVTSLWSSHFVNDESLDLVNQCHSQLKSSSDDLIGSLSAGDMELSEDYTCVTLHGPNPRTTHIFCDCVLKDCQAIRLNDSRKKEAKEIELSQAFASSEVPPLYPSNDFLSFCHLCHKKLGDDQDIYIYRGDTAFCSMECRCQGIYLEEEKEKSANKPDEFPKSDKGRNLFEPGIFVEL